MLTKDELLQKGISEEVADEIIASLESEDENPLQALNKALEDEPNEDLFKAEGEDEDEGQEDKDDYDEKYMKKYMKKYMMANKGSCQKMMKELGFAGEKMKKAIEDVDTDAEGAVVEMVDLSNFLSEQSEFGDSMVKAVSNLAEENIVLSERMDKMFDLLQKASKVTAVTAESLGTFLSEPQGKKGKTAVEIDMAKAKAPASTSEIVYSALMKAVSEKDRKAGEIIGKYESSGRNISLLAKEDKMYINELISKEGK